MRITAAVASLMILCVSMAVADTFQECLNKEKGSWLKCSQSAGVEPPKGFPEIIKDQSADHHLGAPSGAELLYNQLYK